MSGTAGSDAMSTLEALLARRHSCRAFRPDPVPRPVIERILSAAQRVPSWCNAQPWQVALTSGAATERLRAALLAAVDGGAVPAPDIPFPTGYSGVLRQRRSDCGWQLYGAVGVARGDRAGAARQSRENFRFFGAPHVAVLTSPKELGTYGVLDCGGYITAFTLAAAALGVASIPQAAVAPYAAVLRAELDLGADRDVVAAISFGYADESHPANGFRTPRAPLGEVVRFFD